jgi:hypothetical protein
MSPSSRRSRFLVDTANVSITMDRYVQAVTPAKREAQSRIVRSIPFPKWDRGTEVVPIRSQIVDGSGCNCLNVKGWALNSAVECHLHTVTIDPPAVDYKEVR